MAAMGITFAIALSSLGIEKRQQNKPIAGGDTIDFAIDGQTSITFCWIPPGTAQLGSTKEERMAIVKSDNLDSETPELQSSAQEKRPKYTSAGFWLSKYPVTQAQWNALGVERKTECYFSKTGRGSPSVKGTDTSQFPVESISWEESKAFVAALNARMTSKKTFGVEATFSIPNEDQWEYSARGGSKTHQVYYWGNESNGTQANCKGTEPFGGVAKGPYLSVTTAVGSYEKEWPHPWGLCDMSGNVWQWCENSNAKEENKCIVRGGCWCTSPGFCTSASRRQHKAELRASVIGFRVAAIQNAK